MKKYCVLSLLLLLPAASIAQSYDLAGDWGAYATNWASAAPNPNGNWAYGYWSNTVGATGFTLMGAWRERDSFPTSADVYGYDVNRSQDDLFIYKNNGPADPDNSFFDAPAQQNEVGFYAMRNDTTAAQWTATSTTEMTVSGDFHGIAPSLSGDSSSGATLDVGVLLNGAYVDGSQSWTVTGGGSDTSYSFDLLVHSGDVIDFVETPDALSQATSPWLYSNQVDAHLASVPEPSAYLALALPCFGLAFRRRVRKGSR